MFIVVRYQNEDRFEVYPMPENGDPSYWIEKINNDTLNMLFDCGGVATYDVYAVEPINLASHIMAGYGHG